LAPLRLRDRDAIVTKEGLIFRVFGYSHPPESYICDAEYASAKIFRSGNPKAFRKGQSSVFYKFYEDEGWKFIQEEFPQYMIFHEMLQRKVAGVNHRDVIESRKPKEALRRLVTTEEKDQLLTAMHSVLDKIAESTGLTIEDFGVFGSLLHGFYHPKFSDIDLIIYGHRNAVTLRETLKDLYADTASPLKNEFETEESIREKDWHFQNFSLTEYLWHQRRKLIYALFDDRKSGRIIKTEFEPVRNWNEIRNEYATETRILQKGWTRILARVTEDKDAFFIPSAYSIEPLEVVIGPRDAVETKRVVSYMEEFRMQAEKGETVDVEGNLEQVDTSKGSFYQVTLTYCPRYYEQAMKTKN
jgi:predicted nucleotidyltransferase